MKKYLFTMATAAMLFASCSSDDTVVDNGANEEGLVEIKLGTRAKVGVESRAEITDLAGLEVGILAVDRTSMAENDAILKNVKGIASTSATAEGYDIALQSDNNTKYYYPSIAGTTYDFFGYHPYTLNGVTFGDNIVATGDFTQENDILAGRAAQVADAEAANAWSANYYKNHRKNNTAATDPSIVFNHMNARFVIEIKRGPTFNEDNCILESVTMDLPETYTLTFTNGENPTIAYTNTDETANTVATDNAGFTAPTDNSALPVVDFMVPSGVATHTFNLNFRNRAEATPIELVFNELFEDADTVTDTQFEAGKIYTITLTINGPEEITVKATLTEWKPGGNFGVEI